MGGGRRGGGRGAATGGRGTGQVGPWQGGIAHTPFLKFSHASRNRLLTRAALIGGSRVKQTGSSQAVSRQAAFRYVSEIPMRHGMAQGRRAGRIVHAARSGARGASRIPARRWTGVRRGPPWL